MVYLDMNNIDLLRKDVSVGDFVTIELTSGKSIRGTIIEIDNTVILEKTDKTRVRLLDAIIGGWEKDVDLADSEAMVAGESKAEEPNPPSRETSSLKESTDNKGGDASYGLKVVGKIDLSKFEGLKHSAKKTATLPSTQGTGEALNPSSGESSPLKASASDKVGGTSSGLKVVGKIDLTKFGLSPKAHLIQDAEYRAIVKPDVVVSSGPLKFSSPLLHDLSENECKDKERELSQLIQNGDREDCLTQSYELLAKYRPTPKYYRSFLDRIVNTEIALDHTPQAITALAELIAFSEQRAEETNPSNLSHLYVSLARLLRKEREFTEALKALDCASYLVQEGKGLSKNIQNLRGMINREKDNPTRQLDGLSSDQTEQAETQEETIVVSKMLQQDVEFRASTLEDEESEPDDLLARANDSSTDINQTFELRAQLYLDAAASFFRQGLEEKTNYKKAVAHYARLKGNSMLLRIQNSWHKFPDNKDELIAYIDSACNYYTEALGIYNGFGQKRYLQELFLKYLKLQKLSSLIQGGKTPDPDWLSGSLKDIIKDSIGDVNSVEFSVFAKTCISVGSAAEGAWNSLSQDKDGTGPFMRGLQDASFREKVYQVFNDVEQSEIETSLKAGDFLHSIFDHRQERIRRFSGFLTERLKWKFDQFEIGTFNEEWKHVRDFYDILLTTDINAIAGIDKVIKTLLPYADLNDPNRMQRLISAQQTLIKGIDTINDTTTFYGRTFFYQLETMWLRRISKVIEEKYEKTQPKLVIEPDPHFIKKAEDGGHFISFVVTNVGESTADSFVVEIVANGVHEEITNSKTLDADKSASFSCPITVDAAEEFVSVKFIITTYYNGRKLNPSSFENTYEQEWDKPFQSDIPWTIDGTPEKNVFVGRQDTLDMLLKHYLSKERSRTYIMYGLTRTGKTSILDYLRENIDGRALDEKPDFRIKAFSWPFQNVAYKKDARGTDDDEVKTGDKERRFWEFLLKTSLYDILPENLQDAIDDSYKSGEIPDVVGQSDFLKIIDVLNENHVMPFFAVDEFSNVRLFLDDGGFLNASFLSILRDMSLNGKACFIYAGTYDIEELPRNKEYGITGQLVHTRPLEVNSISDAAADMLIDSWDELKFEPRAKEYIKNLSGRVPYWIQWICLDCGKYALSHNYHHLGYSEVNKVVQILTGEVSSVGDKTITWEKIDITNFQQNQYMPGEYEDAECAVISCIAFINKGNCETARGVSIKDMQAIWDNYYVSIGFQQKMLEAIRRMVVRRTLCEYTDENRVVYKLNVDLFRRYWYAKYPNISAFLTLK